MDNPLIQYIFHIKTICNAFPLLSKKLWTIRRMKALCVDICTLTQLWRTEPRVHLKAQAPFWHSSILMAHSRSLALAQRVAAIAGGWLPSHSEQLKELALEPLDTCRIQLCLWFTGQAASRSCHQDMFPLAASGLTVTTRRTGRGLYREPLCRTPSYGRSAVPYLTRRLNKTGTNE